MIGRHGVTLTELLVTIIIIAILSVVVATNLSTGTEAAEKAQMQAMAGEITDALRLAIVRKPAVNQPPPGIAAWNTGPTPQPDPTHWEYFLSPGDYQRCHDNRASFGYICPNAGGIPNGWGNPNSYRGHPTSGSGLTNFDPPTGVRLPEKVWYILDDAWSDAKANLPPGTTFVEGGLPYTAP